jgi:hypothetical protein
MFFKIYPYIALVVLTIVSGLADGYGFANAAKMWGKEFNWTAFYNSALGFILGISSFWLSSKYMHMLGINSAEIQTAMWFAFTIVGVALFSGVFFQWGIIDKMLAVSIIVALGVLMIRVGA